MSKRFRESYEDFVIKNGVLVKYNGVGGDVVIPDEVVEIWDRVFPNNKTIRSVTMPNVKRIHHAYERYGTFEGCDNLVSVHMPNVEIIGGGAFRNCKSLKSLFMPKVKTIEADVFEDCTSLENVSAPNALDVGTAAFVGCISLKTLSMPNVLTIGVAAFMGCKSLLSAEIPNVEEVKDRAFEYCVALSTVNISSDTEVGKDSFRGTPVALQINQQFNIMDFVIEDGVLLKYNGTEKDVVVPNEVVEIGDSAFYNNKFIQSISMPSIKRIDDAAFCLCKSITNIDLPNVQEIGVSAFIYCTSLKSLIAPKVKIIKEHAFYHCGSLADVELPQNARVSKWAFDGTPIEDEIKERFPITERTARKSVRKPIKEYKEEIKVKETDETPDVEKILRSMVKKYDGILQYGASFGEDEKQFMVAFDDETGKWIALDDNNEMIGDADFEELDEFVAELLKDDE
jgi:hypothetical protein